MIILIRLARVCRVCVVCVVSCGVGQVASPGGRVDGPLYCLLAFVSHRTGQLIACTTHDARRTTRTTRLLTRTRNALLAVCTQSLFDQALGVSEEDIEERTPSVHIRYILRVPPFLTPPHKLVLTW